MPAARALEAELQAADVSEGRIPTALLMRPRTKLTPRSSFSLAACAASEPGSSILAAVETSGIRLVADEITRLVQAAGAGDRAAFEALFARVYDELKLLARKQLGAASGHTLNTTGLVHEAYLKLAQPGGNVDLRGRVHFFALAAKAMRQIVIDRARARIADKRGGGNVQLIDIAEASEIADSELGPDELLKLDRALTQLAADEPRLADLVELRFFAGLEIQEIAALHEVSERTLNRDWRRAKAHLHAALYPDA